MITNICSNMENNNSSWYSVLLYYKGEPSCPFALDDPRSTFWNIEQCWLDDVLPNERLSHEYFVNFIDDFPDCFRVLAPKMPTGLKAFFYEQYTHFGGSREGFEAWLLAYLQNAEVIQA